LIFYLGIDDTGPPGKSGSSQTALALGLHLQARKLVRLVHVSAHALVPAAEVPHSSLNHAYCLTLEGETQQLREIDMESRVYLMHNAAAGANPGFALAPRELVNERILNWGKACQMMLLERREALDLARSQGITSAGFTGSGSGVIGALAAVGLRSSGSDGWITWLPGLPDLKGVMTFSEILRISTFDYVKSLHGRTPDFRDRIRLGEQVMPLLYNDHSLLLLAPAPRSADWEWTALELRDKTRIDW
jgi:hypothetical protein